MRRFGGFCPAPDGCETVITVNDSTLTVRDSAGELAFNLTTHEVDRLASLISMPDFSVQMAMKPTACDTGYDGQIVLIFDDENGAQWQQPVQLCPHENILRRVADVLFVTMAAHLECPFFDEATTHATTSDDQRRWACVDCGELCLP